MASKEKTHDSHSRCRQGLYCPQQLFLLLERCQSDTARHPEYDIPGGGVENGESYLQALEREIAEETGLKANIRQPLRAWNYSEKEGEMLYGVTFAADYVSGTVRLSDEHQAWQWIDFDNLETLDLPRWIKEEARLAAQIVIPASSAVCPPQVTRTHAGVYGIIRNACNQLLVIRKRRGPYSGRFDLPGGSPKAGKAKLKRLPANLRKKPAAVSSTPENAAGKPFYLPILMKKTAVPDA